MKALILAAGFGVRLREIFHGRPKHLIPVGGRPFLHHLISLLRRNGIRDIVIAVGYLSDHIIREVGDGRKLGVKVSYSIDDRPLGTAGTVKQAEGNFDEDFFVINGDTYFDIDYQKLYSFHRQKKSVLTIVGKTKKRKDKGGLLLVKEERLVEGQKRRLNTEMLVNGGVYVFNPSVLRFCKTGERLSLEKDLIPILLKNKERIVVYKTKKEFYDVGSPEQYEKVKSKINEI